MSIPTTHGSIYQLAFTEEQGCGARRHLDSEGSGLAREMDQVQQLSGAKVLEVTFQRHLDLPLIELSVQPRQRHPAPVGPLMPNQQHCRQLYPVSRH